MIKRGWEGHLGGGGRDGRARMTCRNTAQRCVPLSAGQPTQREECTTKGKGRKRARCTQFPVVSPFFCSACLARELFTPVESHQISSGQLCVQTSFRGRRRFGGTADSAGGASRRKRAGLVTSPSLFACFLIWFESLL